METVTWQVVAAILGSVVAILTFLYGILGKKNTNISEAWKNEVSTDSAVTKEQINHIQREIESLRKELRKEIHDIDQKTTAAISKFEQKLDKFTDVIIENLRNN